MVQAETHIHLISSLPEHVRSLVLSMILQSFLAILVIYIPFIFILQYLVCIVDIVKFLHCFWVIWVLIGVILHCQLAICFLDYTSRVISIYS